MTGQLFRKVYKDKVTYYDINYTRYEAGEILWPPKLNITITPGTDLSITLPHYVLEQLTELYSQLKRDEEIRNNAE